VGGHIVPGEKKRGSRTLTREEKKDCKIRRSSLTEQLGGTKTRNGALSSSIGEFSPRLPNPLHSRGKLGEMDSSQASADEKGLHKKGSSKKVSGGVDNKRGRQGRAF